MINKYPILGLLLIVLFSTNAWSEEHKEPATIPIATQWTFDAVGSTGRGAITSVYMIICPDSKGTGFLVDNGIIITAAHVVVDCAPNEIRAISCTGQTITFSNVRSDPNKDIAALTPRNPVSGGLKLAETSNIEIGTMVTTWGYPLTYDGPSPLLSVGYLSGFLAYRTNYASITGDTVKHLIVNAALNSGNSGGPLFSANKQEVIGLVVSKTKPVFNHKIQSAIDVLLKYSGKYDNLILTGTDENGKYFTEPAIKVIAEMIKSLQEMGQVMIGESVAVEELATFLNYRYTSKQN